MLPLYKGLENADPEGSLFRQTAMESKGFVKNFGRVPLTQIGKSPYFTKLEVSRKRGIRKGPYYPNPEASLICQSGRVSKT